MITLAIETESSLIPLAPPLSSFSAVCPAVHLFVISSSHLLVCGSASPLVCPGAWGLGFLWGQDRGHGGPKGNFLGVKKEMPVLV